MFEHKYFGKYIIIVALLFCMGKLLSQERPNIIFILTDDQAPWALGLSGDPNASTPNMDQLAREGAYLKNAFITTPVCSPSRISIMTGRYSSEYNVLDFIPHPKHKLYNPAYNPGIDPASTTFAEVIQDLGYVTGLVGKWHLGDWILSSDKKFHPTNHGFDYFMGLPGGGAKVENPVLEKDGTVRECKGLTTDILTDNALEFIQTYKNRSFLLCFNTRAPHSAWLPVDEDDWAPFDEMDPVLPNPGYPDLNTAKAKNDMKEYLASTRGVDRSIGKIMDLLEKLNLKKNTVIVFYSDHGYNMGHNGIRHKGNGIWLTNTIPEDAENIMGKYRPNLYDNSIKVPAFVYWPGVIKGGTVIEETITSLDLYPTLVGMAGGEIPSDHMVRGRSIIPLLKGDKIDDWNNDYYGEYSMINYGKSFMRCFRTSEWKLVIDFLNPGRNELYHIAFDPEENINLYSFSNAELDKIKSGLKLKIIQKMREIADPLLKEESNVRLDYYLKY
ncbi:sulfatase family protein [Membranihabitans maritimus]|uniref:sulfatase family protein n=1 Tax=Membranihabitans maritimus TaxID=2904244 RepID=UPI001EFF9626|nr:sulfatase-like hydrolase/transferase [Membranihabitans maritimus]